MGKRGKPPLPSSVIDIRGGARHYHRTKEDLEAEPTPDPNIPPCPEHLDLIARQEWMRMSVELDECGILTNLDMGAFASYCNSYSRWVQETMIVQEEGSVITLKTGYVIQNPHLGIANKAEEMMLRAAGTMGITPSSRGQVKKVDKKPKETDRKERFFR